MRRIFLLLGIFIGTNAFSQHKKPLDHSVYDHWQSIGERKLSNDGKFIIYCVDVQEGDGELIIQSSNEKYKEIIPRGYDVAITEDSRFAIFKIKPLYSDIRQARIKKKKPEEFPKDSLAIVELALGNIIKEPHVKSYKIPENNAQWLAWQLEKQPGDSASKKEEGTSLIIFDLSAKSKHVIEPVGEYVWSKNGKLLVFGTTTSRKDSLLKPSVCVFRTIENRFDTLLKGGNDFRNYTLDEEGYQVAFVAERDSNENALQKFHKLWYWKNGYDSARMIADKNTIGMPIGWGVSEQGKLQFSKSGKRLFFGTAPIQPPKDTSLIDIDLVKIDIWNYKDDYLQSMQLKNLDKDLKKSYMAVIDLEHQNYTQLGDEQIPEIVLGKEGDGSFFVGITDVGKRIAMQWEGRTLKDIYVIDPETSKRTLIKKNLSGQVSISPDGKYVLWYDAKTKQYFTWRSGKIKNISAGIPAKLYNEDFDMPSEPPAYGVMTWTRSDLAVLIYDKYDIWQLDPDVVVKPFNLTGGAGRKNKIIYRFINFDPDQKFISPAQEILLSMFAEKSKQSGLATLKMVNNAKPVTVLSGSFAINNRMAKAKNADAWIYTKESYQQSPDIYLNTAWNKETRLSFINPQQADYNWGTAELFYWKAYDGKQATGIVYKPEDFDPRKKYPVICYFYEKLSDGLFQYIPPTPTPSRLNISFFVSRGYIVFVPDIIYTIGHPGKSAFNYVVSGARALVRKGWADSTRMGLQGQSWGGYQTAYIITQTPLFKAAWAGAPVSNMTSAYGGIRWSTGMNREFQYEKTQSRIGATLWEKPQLYIENSPLFHLPKVKTPLVIMHNDNDGAVPWYQGIELFTGLRRLNKAVWMLNYNGEEHNLMERKNRKDIQVREQQFFDWLLRGQRAAQWLSDGVPATMKGKVWGLEE